MKKTGYFILSLILILLCGAVPASAESRFPWSSKSSRLVDEADLLTPSEESEILKLLDDISERRQCDVVVAIVRSLNGKDPMSAADDFFDYNGYGYGTRGDGILFLQCPATRDIAISTSGSGMTAFTDAGQQYIYDAMRPYLRDGDHAKAYKEFASLCDDFLTQAEKGKPYDVGRMPKKKNPLMILAGFLGGIVIGFVMGFMKRAAHRTVRRRITADTYAPAGGIRLTENSDLFMDRYVVKRKIERESHSGGGGGGSAVHTGSSGRSHGGSSSKY